MSPPGRANGPAGAPSMKRFSVRPWWRVGALAVIACATQGLLASCGSSHNDDFEPSLLAVDFAANTWVASGQTGSIANSGDGSNFLLQSVSSFGTLFGVTFGGGLWITCGDNGVVFTSTDTAIWFPIFLNFS